MSEQRPGFTLPFEDIEAAVGRGVARALEMPARVLSLDEVEPEHCPVCQQAAAARTKAELFGGAWEPCPVHGERVVTRRAPVQAERARKVRGKPAPPRPAGTIAWAEHLEAYEAYARRYGREQSAERLAERGGFSFYELVDLLGREPTTWEPR